VHVTNFLRSSFRHPKSSGGRRTGTRSLCGYVWTNSVVFAHEIKGLILVGEFSVKGQRYWFRWGTNYFDRTKTKSKFQCPRPAAPHNPQDETRALCRLLRTSSCLKRSLTVEDKEREREVRWSRGRE
jgi:hypothetical protein